MSYPTLPTRLGQTKRLTREKVDNACNDNIAQDDDADNACADNDEDCDYNHDGYEEGDADSSEKRI